MREKLKLTWRKLSIWNSLETRFFSLCRPWFSTSRTEFNPVKFALELKILRTTDGFVKCGGQALALKFLRNYSQKAIFFYKFLYFSKRKMAFCLVLRLHKYLIIKVRTSQSRKPLSVIFEERYQIEDFANLKIYWPLPFWFLNFMPNNFCVKILKIELKFMLKIILFIFENCTESHAENKSVLTVLIFKILGWGILNICLKNWN